MEECHAWEEYIISGVSVALPPMDSRKGWVSFTPLTNRFTYPGDGYLFEHDTTLICDVWTSLCVPSFLRQCSQNDNIWPGTRRASHTPE